MPISTTETNCEVASAAPPHFVSIREAARIAALGRTSIFYAIRDGRLAARKYGSRTLVEYSSLVAFCDGPDFRPWNGEIGAPAEVAKSSGARQRA